MGFLEHWINAGVQEAQPTCFHRRRLLAATASAVVLAAAPGVAQAATRTLGGEKVLAFSHTHTGEQLSLVYKVGDRYVPDAMSRITHLMRDFRSGERHPMDPALLDVLWQMQNNLNVSAPFEIISAYRSPNTNKMLRGRSAHSGVAKSSMHLKGQAIDVRLLGVALGDVRDAALELKRGGVGYYADSDFVHLDTGRVRRW